MCGAVVHADARYCVVASDRAGRGAERGECGVRRSVVGGQPRRQISPKWPSSSRKYPAHPIATPMLPTAYSMIRSQPMIQATNSPIVAYAYVYADPEIGHHRRELGVAERGEPAGDGREQKREDDRRSRPGTQRVADDRRAGGGEDPGADRGPHA